MIWTGLSAFPIDQMPPLVLSLCSIGSKKISDTRSATDNGLMEDVTHDPVELFNPTH